MTFSMSPLSPSAKINMEDEVCNWQQVFHFYADFSKEEEKVPLKSLKDLEEEKANEKKKQQRFVSLNKTHILQ